MVFLDRCKGLAQRVMGKVTTLLPSVYTGKMRTAYVWLVLWPVYLELVVVKLIIIFVYCNWVFTRWQSFLTHIQELEAVLLNLHREGYMRSM